MNLLNVCVRLSKRKQSHIFKNRNFTMFLNLNRSLAIAVLSLAVGGAAIPSIVAAQSNPTTGTPSVNQRQHRGDGFKKLNLTESQKQQMKSIHENTKRQIEGVLTSEQRAKLANAIQAGDRKGAWKSLNLTASQKQQIRSIREAGKQQSMAILTPDQRAQLEQMLAERRNK
jgi:periplasmic protein CpxP/Spy